MRLDNGKISERQSFRMGLLENITLGIVVLPYICTGNAGEWHYMAFALGLLFTFIYSLIIYGFARAFPDGMIEETDGLLGYGSRLIDVLYSIRYIIRASLIILFFSVMLRAYMLRSFNVWWVIISFTVICGYGASRDIEKRGRLLELLFWWMIVPLILVAVFSVSNVDWHLMNVDKNADYKGIMRGAYLMLVIMSSVETMLFTLTKVKKKGWSNYLKTIIWILISVLFSYIFVQGVIGDKWAGDSSMSVLYVMEAAGFPGGLERFDYAVIAFFLIGVFSVVSGYMFYAKEFLRVAFSKRWNVFEKEDKDSRGSSVEVVSDKWWVIAIVMLLTVLFVWLWSLIGISDILADYLIWFDVGISIFVPLLVLFIKKLKGKFKSGLYADEAVKPLKAAQRIKAGIFGRKIIGLFVALMAGSFFITGCKTRINYKRLDDRQSSLESMDYAVTLTVKNEKNDEKKAKQEEADRPLNEPDHDIGHELYFKFEIADLSDYKGDSQDLLSTTDYECMAWDLDAALDMYYEAREKHVDLGHLKLIKLYGETEDVICELKNLPSVNKSVEVEIYEKDGVRKIKLRNLIRTFFDREDF